MWRIFVELCKPRLVLSDRTTYHVDRMPWMLEFALRADLTTRSSGSDAYKTA